MDCLQMRETLIGIFNAGLERVDPCAMISRHVSLVGDRLTVVTEEQRLEIDLRDYKRIFLLGAGKASGPMALAFEEMLGDRIEKGLICVKYGHTVHLQRAELVEAGHPIPDENGVAAAKRLAGLADLADAETLVINCISGGGSALLPYPLDEATSGGRVDLSLEVKQRATGVLLRCGASIQEINCVRKHISAIKGGRLLQRLYPARALNFILSDVVGDDLGSIASGMTTCDHTTFLQALEVIERYRIEEEIPRPVLLALEHGAQGRIPETVKPGDPCLDRVDNILIGTNRQALQAAAARAKEKGFHVQAVTAQLTGEARHAAKVLADIARDVAVSDMFTRKPACLLFGGETVVTLQGQGKGGRNQELALAFLREMTSWKTGAERVFFLAASTDGNDGPTDAAGAFADLAVLSGQGRDAIEASLRNNDSYHFFEQSGALLKTGPTNTNVCDLQIVLIV